VWYVLVDGEGEAYKGTKGSSVDIPSSYVTVDRFRKILKAENSNILANIDPTQLQVYKNKVAFNGKDEPLDAREEIGEKLDSVDELCVVVPSHALVAVPDGLQEVLNKFQHKLDNMEQILLKESVKDQEVLNKLESVEKKLENVDDKLENVDKKLENVDNKLENVDNKLENVEQDLQELKRPRSSFTRSAIGDLIRQALERKKSFVALEDKERGVAVWGATEQTIVSEILTESELVEFVTPYLANILEDFEMVFVNSENIPWLRQHSAAKSSTMCKPDGFATHAGMYRKKDEIRFGLMEPKLMDCMMIIEAKLSICDDSFGQVISYLEFVKQALVDENCPFCPLADTPALLFDRQGFWLISSTHGTPIYVETMKWTQPGSKDVLTDFVRKEIPDWITLLTDACRKHGVSVVEGASFLGSGAFSRVFKVMSQTDMEPLALKIVPSKSRGRAPSLHVERQMLEKAAERHVAAVTPVGDCKILLAGLASSLLLKPVGSPISRSELRNVQVLRSIFDALFQLHQAQCQHGDPRVENRVWCGQCSNSATIRCCLRQSNDWLTNTSSILQKKQCEP
jgi:hypothetical protein